MVLFRIRSVLISDDIDKICPEILTENGIQVTQKTKLPLEQLKAEIQNYDALIVRSATKVTKDVIGCAPRLKLIGRAGTGVDNVDVEEATKKGIIVMNTPSGNTRSAAELTCGMIMNLSRKIPQANQSMKEGKWERKGFMGSEVSGKTLAIIGLGRIGGEVAIRMRAFGMKIVGFDLANGSKDIGVERKILEEIWRIADYITVHVPLVPKTKDLINSAVFAKTKAGVFIINCARGGIINEADLLSALNSGVCAGAALDVFEQEPPLNRTLLNHPNVICTPHLGASTREAQFRVAEEIAHQIAGLNQGRIQGTLNARPLAAALARSKMPWITAVKNLSSILVTVGKIWNCSDIRDVCVEFPEKYAAIESALKAASIVGMLKMGSSNLLNLINADVYGKAAGITVMTKPMSENVVTVSASEKLFVSGLPSEAGTILQKIGKNAFTTGVLCSGTIVFSRNQQFTHAEVKLMDKHLGFVRSDSVDGERWTVTLFDRISPQEADYFTPETTKICF